MSLPVPASASPCPKCQTFNSPQTIACSMCGARLPWADALQQQRLEERNEAVVQTSLQAQHARAAKAEKIGQTANAVAGWVMPFVAVGAVVLLVGAVMLMGARGGFIILPIGLIVRLIMNSFWND